MHYALLRWRKYPHMNTERELSKIKKNLPKLLKCNFQKVLHEGECLKWDRVPSEVTRSSAISFSRARTSLFEVFLLEESNITSPLMSTLETSETRLSKMFWWLMLIFWIIWQYLLGVQGLRSQMEESKCRLSCANNLMKADYDFAPKGALL